LVALARYCADRQILEVIFASGNRARWEYYITPAQWARFRSADHVYPVLQQWGPGQASSQHEKF
jgi:hypothetical protein